MEIISLTVGGIIGLAISGIIAYFTYARKLTAFAPYLDVLPDVIALMVYIFTNVLKDVDIKDVNFKDNDSVKAYWEDIKTILKRVFEQMSDQEKAEILQLILKIKSKLVV